MIRRPLVAANDGQLPQRDQQISTRPSSERLTDADRASAMAALGEPIRRELVERLIDSPSSVTRLAEHFPVSRAAISQHLKVLLDAGVVGYRKRGALNIYSVNPEPLVRLERYMRELCLRVAANPARIAG